MPLNGGRGGPGSLPGYLPVENPGTSLACIIAGSATGTGGMLAVPRAEDHVWP